MTPENRVWQSIRSAKQWTFWFRLTKPGVGGRQLSTLASLLTLAFALASNADAGTFGVATYNVNWGNRQGDRVLAAITQADPDLICFQETTTHSERFLRQRLAKMYPHFHSVGHEGRFAAERFTFASKHKLTELVYVPPTAGLFGFYSCKLDVDELAVHVVNVHLTPFSVKRGRGFAGAMTALSETEESHRIEIEAILDHVDPESPTIIVGDFNSISTFIAPKKLIDLGFMDAFASVHEDADSHPTWSWPTRPLPLALRIDYIFHTSHFATSKSGIIREVGSDHSLVFAELTRKGLDATTSDVRRGKVDHLGELMFCKNSLRDFDGRCDT